MPEGLYDRAMILVRDAIRAQEIWQSPATLVSDLRMALTLLDSLNPPDCPKCGLPMNFTATAPSLNAPMEWRCFGHVEHGTTEGQGLNCPWCGEGTWNGLRCLSCGATELQGRL